jgi:hypothetical protein
MLDEGPLGINDRDTNRTRSLAQVAITTRSRMGMETSEHSEYLVRNKQVGCNSEASPTHRSLLIKTQNLVELFSHRGRPLR